MPRVRLRLELPPDLHVSDEEVRAAVLHGLSELKEDPLYKAQGHAHESEVRKLPHRYPQSLIEKSGKVYAAQMERMIDEIVEALLS